MQRMMPTRTRLGDTGVFYVFGAARDVCVNGMIVRDVIHIPTKSSVAVSFTFDQLLFDVASLNARIVLLDLDVIVSTRPRRGVICALAAEFDTVQEDQNGLFIGQGRMSSALATMPLNLLPEDGLMATPVKP
jgi:hypothetical protein